MPKMICRLLNEDGVRRREKREYNGIPQPSGPAAGRKGFPEGEDIQNIESRFKNQNAA